MAQPGFDSRFDEDTRTILVSGSVDDAEAFGRVVMGPASAPETTTTIDLSGVTFFPSSALGVLVRARRAAQRAAGVLRVTSDDGSIAYRVLQVSGFPATSEPAS